VTCGRSEIRIWTLPRVAPTLAADLPSRAFNIAFDENRTALFDGGDGDVYALRREDSSAVLVHKHALLSFGVAWCDGRACSAGWDGRILCSSLESGATETVATFEIATRWLGGRDGHCFAAVSSGGIYDVRSASTPIYRHDREPYRLAISRDGAQLASTDWGGAVKIWDLKSGRLIADIAQLHTGLVVNAIWLDDGRLVTAGYDGFVRLLDAHFKVIQSWYLGSAVRYVAAANETIHAALINGTLWDISLTTYIKRSLSLGVTFTALSVSSDGAFVATGTDDGELFLIDAQHRIAVQRFRQGAVRSVAFESDRTVLSCAPDNRMMRLTFQF
jgi:WD40 repeat protein